jgi:MFS transporter, DHA3 family, macrolide efflux protein
MQVDGRLAATVIGAVLDTGPGRGVGLMFVLAGAAGILVSGLVFANPSVRKLEEEIPDAIPDGDLTPAD